MILAKASHSGTEFLEGVTSWRGTPVAQGHFLGLLLCVPLYAGSTLSAQNSKPTAVTPQIPKEPPTFGFQGSAPYPAVRLSDFRAWSLSRD